MKGRCLALLLAALALLSSMACGGAGDQGAGSLVVYAAREEPLVGPLLQQFSEATGIKVSAKYGGTAEIVGTLLEEGKNSPADVFLSRDPGGLGALSDILAPLPDSILDQVPMWARSHKGLWVGISARVRTVAYNTTRLSEADLPDAIEGFTDPKWKGRIGWSPASGPTQTMVAAMRVVWGDRKTTAWLKDMQANAAVVYPNHTAVVAGVVAGEVDVGLVNHYYVYQFMQERGAGVPVRDYYFRSGGPGNLVMVTGGGILSTSKNSQNGETLLRFMLSETAQQYLTSQNFDYPLVEGVPPHALLRPLSDIQRPNVSQDDLMDTRGTVALLREAGILP